MSAGEKYNEKGLLSDVASGEQAAFGMLYSQYGDIVFKLVLKYLGSVELAKDVSQEIFLKIWVKREKLKKVNDVRFYLLKTARNHAIDVLRAASKSNTVKGEIARHFYKDNVYLDDVTLHKDYRTFIQRTIEALPPRAKEVFLLCREEGKSYDEIAAALGISRNAVRNSMNLALNKFRDAAQDEFGATLGAIMPVLIWLYQFNEGRGH